MPLVRVSGSDAESFDTFDVAEMADHRNTSQRSSWSARQIGTSSITPTSRYATNFLSPMSETDDLTSIDSSSGRKSEIQGRGSSMSVGSINSYHTSGNGDAYGSQMPPPLYETSDDDMQQDPRNPFNKSHNTLRDDYIPEEDETSLSTQDSSSLAPSLQQHSRAANPPHMYQPRPQRPRQKQPPISEADDVSLASHQSHRHRRTSSTDNSSTIVQQLESQVAKLNFELATTKSSLDELKLENRRLTGDKDKLSNDMTLLQEENEQLHLKIERLEKEQLLRNMENTKGVARPAADNDNVVVWAGSSVSGNTWAGGSAYVPVTQRKLGKADGGLEVPFRTQDSDYHVRARRRSSGNSLCSSFNEQSTDGTSRGDFDAQSVALSESNHSLGELPSPNKDEQETATRKGGLKLLNMVGVTGATKQMGETSVSESGAKQLPQSISPQRQDSHSEEGNANANNDIGSNPQGEGEDINDDDPFATWSAPGDPKRRQNEPNWLQRGLGGGRGRDDKGRQRQPPPQDEIIEDPFDTVRGNEVDDPEEYTSFGLGTGSIDGDAEKSASMHDGRKFGLFKGFGRKRET